MDRRYFMRAAACAGFSVFTPWAGQSRGEEPSDFDPYPGPYWLTLNLLGGWDPTMFCDPKGRQESIKDNLPINGYYDASEILTTSSGLRVAPPPMGESFYGDFFDKHGSKITVINGVDAETNGHTQGVRASWSGQLARGYPSLAAVIAAERMRSYQLPLPLLTFGGYEATGNLVAPTRLSNTSLMLKAVAPNVARFDGLERSLYQEDFALKLAQDTANARLAAERSNAALPRTGRGLDALFTARLSEKNVGRLLDYLDVEEANTLPGRGDGFIKRQAYIALAAFEAGLCVSANVTLGGWDSHGGNDENQDKRYRQLFEALDLTMQWAEDRGIQDKLNIIVASDFGRTPYYNGNDGKDHWSVSSWMIIQGDRDHSQTKLFGATDDKMQAVPLAADGSLAPDTGAKITPAHMHRALRSLSGVAQNSPILAQYPLDVEEIAFFS